MKCNICGTENPDGKKFCSNCGSNLTGDNFNNGDEVFVNAGDAEITSVRDNKEHLRLLNENRQQRRLRERERKMKKRSFILNVLIALVMLIIIINTVYICAKRGSLPQQESSSSIGVFTVERRTSV